MTTTGEHLKRAELTVDTRVPLVRIVREFDAPPGKVFQAHADPDLFSKWNGPRGTTMHVDRHDFRSGGSYRYSIERKAEGFAAWFNGCFHEVRPHELIVQTFCFEPMSDSVALEKVVFEDIGNGRTRLTTTSLVDSFEARDAFVASGMEGGVQDGYQRLDEILAAFR
jgi:uncharacterized protein YndB with AHSA1/START domain